MCKNVCSPWITGMRKCADVHAMKFIFDKTQFWGLEKEMLSKEGESKLGQVDDKWDVCNNIFGFNFIFSLFLLNIFFGLKKSKCFPKKSFPKKIEPDWDNWQQICCFKNCPSFSLNFFN